MTHKHLDKRKQEYDKVSKHKELYGSKLAYLPLNLISFLQDHKEINFSAFVTKQVYRLKEQVEKQEYLDRHQDLIGEARRKNDPR